MDYIFYDENIFCEKPFLKEIVLVLEAMDSHSSAFTHY